MRVLHGPVEVAGQVHQLARAQRRLGWRVETWCPPHPYGYPVLEGSRTRRVGGPERWLPTLVALAAVPLRYDVVHFHGGQSFLQPRFGQRDAAAFRRAGVRVLQHFVGSDARLPSEERRRNPWYVNSFGEDDEQAHRRMERWSALSGGHCAVQDHALHYALEQHFDAVHVLPLALDLEELAPAYPGEDVARPRLVHAPSNLPGKGTDLVRAAVEALQCKGIAFDYVELTGRTHADLLEQLRGADLVVDQLRLGSYGTVSVEAWALGKPAVCYVLPEVREHYPQGLPVIDADAPTLTDVLEHWLTDGALRHRRGRESRAYAEAHHDATDVARRTADVYAALP